MLRQLCADGFPHSMDQHQIEIKTGNDGNSAEIEEPAAAAVGSKPRFQNYTSVAHEALEVFKPNVTECEIRAMTRARALGGYKEDLWMVAWEEFNNRLKSAENSSYKGEEEIRSVKNEIYQVVGFFSAFQGLLITAAAQSNLLRCNNVGFVLALSAYATAVAVFGIWQKITAVEELRSANIKNTDCIKELHRWLKYLQDSGKDFEFGFFDNKSDFSNYSHTSWKEILVNVGTWLVVSVIAFGGLCMVTMRQIVCNPGHSLPSN